MCMGATEVQPNCYRGWAERVLSEEGLYHRNKHSRKADDNSFDHRRSASAVYTDSVSVCICACMCIRLRNCIDLNYTLNVYILKSNN